MLGRNWIGIDTSHEAISATLRRFIHGTERMGDFVQRDRDAQHGAEDEEHQLALFTDDAVHGGRRAGG